MKSCELPLTKGFVAIIDTPDYSRAISLGKWQASICDGHIYAGHATNRTVIRLHNYLTGWSYVDHINGDGLDNRRANLRQATQSLNNANQRLSSASKTGFKGVHLFKRTGRYKASLGYGGKSHHLGYFATPEEAAHAYDEAARAVFGEFARTNFGPMGVAS